MKRPLDATIFQAMVSVPLIANEASSGCHRLPGDGERFCCGRGHL